MSAAYFGLATLKQPVLNEIKYYLKNDKGFSFDDKLNFIAALAYIGDFEGANEWYNKVVVPQIIENVENNEKYLNFEDDYEKHSNTSFLSMILAKIGHNDVYNISDYVVNNVSKEYTPAIDLVEYIKNYNPKTDSKGYITYIDNNEEITKTFEDSSVLTLKLNERNFSKPN